MGGGYTVDDDGGCQLPGQPLIFENCIYSFMIYFISGDPVVMMRRANVAPMPPLPADGRGTLRFSLA